MRSLVRIQYIPRTAKSGAGASRLFFCAAGRREGILSRQDAQKVGSEAAHTFRRV